MTNVRLLTLLLVVVIFCPFGQSQEAKMPASVDGIYRNFLGTWEGSSERTVDGRVVQEKIELAITEEPKKHWLMFDYRYDQRADAPRMRRFLKLDPLKETVMMQWDIDSVDADQCAASNLKDFAQSGLGSFTAICGQRGSPGDHRSDLVTFHLGTDTLGYEWATSADGQIYKTYSKFSFKRKP